MKKIILYENQVQKLVSSIVENVPAVRAIEYTMNDGRYHMECEFDFQYDTSDYLVYKGGVILSMEYGHGDVSFMIEIDHQPYGIKGLKIRDIRGPIQIQTNIEYLPPGVKYEDDYFGKQITEKTTIPINWKTARIENDGAAYHKMDYFGLYNEIDVYLEPDGKGGLEGKIKRIIINETEKYEE